MVNSVEFLMKRMGELEYKIKYNFNNRNRLLLAMTHSSYANEVKGDALTSNERLEFLGDAVLNFIISDAIYRKYPDLSEGEMTKARANIVCESSLMKCADDIGIGAFLLLGKGEEITGGRTRPSILSDAFESLIGAIYLDGGIDGARGFIEQTMPHLIDNAVRGLISMDYKTQLQEKVQKNGEHRIIYTIINEKGPDHDKVFVSQVSVDNRLLGIGKGKSKKEAEQNAAKAALESGCL